MPRAFPVRVGSRGERPLTGPRPFSQEWVQTPPELRAPPPRRAPELPAWLPSERVLSAILVILLVLITSFVGGGPGMKNVANGSTKTASIAGTTIAALAGASVVATGTSANAVLVTPPSPTVGAAALGPAATVSDASMTPAATQVLADVSGALLPKYRIVSYYGHPNSTQMGILGEYDMPGLLAQLKDEAAAYEAADPSRPVMPAFELIASVAQNWSADDNTYLLHTDDATIQKYVDFTRENGIILILDIQIGRSTIADEVDRVKKWLVEPHVHLAIDPEFAVGPDEIPNEAIGGVDASKIRGAQETLAKIVKDHNLPPKLLIVHRFTEDMITNADQLGAVDGVQTVIDFDGFGTPDSKLEGYQLFMVGQDYAQFAGIKLFYEKDSPLMSPSEVVALDRPPDVVIYQ
jgi:hypothetical protein